MAIDPQAQGGDEYESRQKGGGVENELTHLILELIHDAAPFQSDAPEQIHESPRTRSGAIMDHAMGYVHRTLGKPILNQTLADA